MAFLYTDCTMNIAVSEESFPLLRNLIGNFNDYLAETTNGLDSKSKGPVYRIVARIMDGGVVAEDLSVITFNQDIQLEKALYAMHRTAKWWRRNAFVFPEMYSLPEPTSIVRWGDGDTFPETVPGRNGITVLKLHGSMNWHTQYEKRDPSLEELFSRDREVSVAANRRIATRLTFRYGATDAETFAQPVMIPAVTHKAGIFPSFLDGIWNVAEAALHEADVILVLGYSCPLLDHESANLFRRSFVGGAGNGSP